MKNKGFSLVELIVVIAIMAILVGVAVPVYTSYIEKSQISKDKQTVSEVAHALQVYAAGNHETVTDDYVVLTPNGAFALEGGFAEAAMKVTFGENWKDDLALEYDNWTDNGVLAQVLANAEMAQTVAGSSYLQNSTAADMLSTVSTLTEALGGMAVTAGKDPLVTLGDFDLLSDDQIADIRAELGANELAWVTGGDNTAYGTALSNILVKALSKEAGSYDASAGVEASGLLQFASTYAALYGWASSSEEGTNKLNALNSVITDPNATTETIVDAFENFTEENTEEDAAFMDYMMGSTGEKDANAFAAIMSVVGELSDDYDMLASGVYSSELVAEQLNDYINTVIAVSSMDSSRLSALDSLEAGSVVIFITTNGSVSVIPAAIVSNN